MNWIDSLRYINIYMKNPSVGSIQSCRIEVNAKKKINNKSRSINLCIENLLRVYMTELSFTTVLVFVTFGKEMKVCSR